MSSTLAGRSIPCPKRPTTRPAHGCASQVWLETHVADSANGPVLTFLADSDAHIVRGLVAIILSIYSGHSARDILETDALGIFRQLGLIEHLTPQRAPTVCGPWSNASGAKRRRLWRPPDFASQAQVKSKQKSRHR